MDTDALSVVIKKYLEYFPPEASGLSLLQKQLEAKEPLDDRRNFNGHITGSAIILSEHGDRILFIHHKLFNVWQQPGGHWEGNDENPLEAAKREGQEETGVRLKRYIPLDAAQPLVPFDIDSHTVPARPHKDEPGHYHHDFRYVFLVRNPRLSHQADEVNAVKWFDINADETNRIKRSIAKLKAARIAV